MGRAFRDEIHDLLGEWSRTPKDDPMRDTTAVVADKIIWKFVDAGFRMPIEGSKKCHKSP